MRRSRTKAEVADLIERFLENRSNYPQEWNDFVECPDPNPAIDAHRRKCWTLDPLVNRPEPVDGGPVQELRSIAEGLRKS